MRRGFAAALRYALLSAGAAIMVLPFADMLVGALRTPADQLARPPVWWPARPDWHNYVRVFIELPMVRWAANSAVVTASVTFLQLATSTMAGYALAKFRFRGREALLRIVLGAQMFPFFLIVIPSFFVIRFWPLAGGNDWLGHGGTGLLGTYAALVLPFTVSWYGIFLMRQFMMGVPSELLDAARIDGASEPRIFVQIVLPLVRPAIATLAIFVFIYQWNEVIWTMTVTRTAPDLQTIPVGIYLARGAFVNVEANSLRQAAVAVGTLPVLVLFLLLQRHYVRGLAMGAVKG